MILGAKMDTEHVFFLPKIVGNPHKKHNGRKSLPAWVSASISLLSQGQSPFDHPLLP